MKHALSTVALAIAALVVSMPAVAQVHFYEQEGFAGRSFSTQEAVSSFGRYGFNDRASSVLVERGRWEVCEDAAFQGRCTVLRQGRYDSLAALGLNDRISSARALNRHTVVTDDRFAPVPPEPAYDDHRRHGERLYQADVTSARAVVGPPERRCWTEQQPVDAPRGDASVPGGIVGAVIGGILGPQVGGGTGRDIATVGGAVAGAVIGAKVGRSRAEPATQPVQRCADQPQASDRPAYWEVTYTFRGREHRMQTKTQPGATVTVNRQGQPRA